MIYEVTRLVAERMARPSTGASSTSSSGSLEGQSAAVFFENDQPTQASGARPIVRVSRDDAGDAFDDAKSTGGRQGASWLQWAGVKVLVQGASNKDGATNVDHMRVVSELADAFLVELQVVAHARKLAVRNVRGKWLKDDDAAREHGTRYELTMQIGRAVLRKQVDVAAATPVAGNVTKVDTGLTTETSCGS